MNYGNAGSLSGLAAVIALCLFALPVNAQWWNPFAPKNYDECVLDNIKGVQGQDAVNALKESCMSKFPPEVPDLKYHPTQEDLKHVEHCRLAEAALSDKPRVMFDVDADSNRAC